MAGGGQPLGGTGQQSATGFGSAPQQGGMPFLGGFGGLRSALSGSSSGGQQGFQSATQTGMTNQPQDPNAGQGLLQAFQGNFSPEATAFQQANPQPQPSFYDAIIGRATSDMQQQQSQNQMPIQQFQQGAQQQATAQNSPMQQSPFGLPPPSVYTTSFPSPSGMAPSFGRMEGDSIVDASGRRIGSIGLAAPQQTSQPPMQRAMQPSFQQMRPQQMSGLQGLFNSMMGQMRGGMSRSPMPQYQNPALNYRPNMQQVQQNLSRVRPSVYKTDLDTARSRIQELEDQVKQFTSRLSPSDSGGGG